MTLTKAKPKRPSMEHRRRVGHHHRHSQPYLKTYWPYLPVLAIMTFGFTANNWLAHLHRDVLGYATDMSIQSLLDDTNAERLHNNESGLALNAQLDQAAKAKANHMAARNYWSHNTPDGQTPWTFMTAAGYTYVTAGENLAYGFATAADTLQGWMNSPEHRANILNTTYRDVGFGIINIPDYQNNGPETLVVAMYGSTTATVAQATPAPAPAAPMGQRHQASPTPAPASMPAAERAPAATPIATTVPANEQSASPTPATRKDIVEPQQQRVTQFQLVASNAPASTAAITIFGLAAFAFVVIRHSLAWRKVLVKSEAFILHHPMLDVTGVTIASVALILSHTAGLIR